MNPKTKQVIQIVINGLLEGLLRGEEVKDGNNKGDLLVTIPDKYIKKLEKIL